MKKFILIILTAFLFITPRIAMAETSDINCLAKAIYFESRGGTESDMKDVGHVVLNRSNSIKFPSNVCSVVFQKIKGKCQFPWACNTYRIKDNEEFERSKEYANELYRQEKSGVRRDPTNKALFFHNFRVAPSWGNYSKCHINKQHIFYN